MSFYLLRKPDLSSADYWLGLRKVGDVWTWADGSSLDDAQVATLPWFDGYATHDCVRTISYMQITQDGCSNVHSVICQTDAAGACLVIIEQCNNKSRSTFSSIIAAIKDLSL